MLFVLLLFGGVAFVATSTNDNVAFSPKMGVLVVFVSDAGVAGELLFSVADDPNLNKNPELGLASVPFVLPPKMLGDPNCGAAVVAVWPNIDGFAIRGINHLIVLNENRNIIISIIQIYLQFRMSC